MGEGLKSSIQLTVHLALFTDVEPSINYWIDTKNTRHFHLKRPVRPDSHKGIRLSELLRENQRLFLPMGHNSSIYLETHYSQHEYHRNVTVLQLQVYAVY